MKTNQVGIFEVKTHLSEILVRVSRGVEIIITNRGKPVAQLTPYKSKPPVTNRNQALMRFSEIRSSNKTKGTIKELIDEGRK